MVVTSSAVPEPPAMRVTVTVPVAVGLFFTVKVRSRVSPSVMLALPPWIPSLVGWERTVRDAVSSRASGALMLTFTVYSLWG